MKQMSEKTKEIYIFLKKRNEWITLNEISKELNTPKSEIAGHLVWLLSKLNDSSKHLSIKKIEGKNAFYKFNA